MNAFETSAIASAALGLVLALGTGGCNDSSARLQQGSERNIPDRTDVDESTRRGAEPAPARGEDRDDPAGEPHPDERTQSTTVLRERIEGLDRKLAVLRGELQQQGQALSASLEEERRMLGQDFEQLQRASASEWEDVRDRIDRRLESMATAVDQAREAAADARP